MAYAEAVLEIQSDHAEAARVRDDARTAVARFDEAIAQARRDLARGDVQAATGSLQTARELDPSAPAVADVSTRLADFVRERDASARAGTERSTPRATPAPRAASSTGVTDTTGAAPQTTPGRTTTATVAPSAPAAAPMPASEPPSPPASQARPESRPSPPPVTDPSPAESAATSPPCRRRPAPAVPLREPSPTGAARRTPRARSVARRQR
jgi:hypothetical protein